MSISLLKLSHLKANDVNLAANDYLHQSVALTTFAGFAHAIERWFNENGCQLTFAATAVMPVIHSVSKPTGFPKSITYDYGSRDKAGIPRLLYQYQGNIEFSAVIAFVDDGLAVTPYEQADSADRRQAFLSFINRQHFAGGTLMPITQKQVSYYKDAQSITTLLDRLVADGYVLEDISPSLNAGSPEDDLLDRLFELIAHRTSNDSDRQGFCVPAAVGFRLLETPQRDRIQRDPHQNYPHAFVEPLLGAIRLRSVGSYKKLYQQRSIPVWWQYQDDGDDLFVKAIATQELIRF